MKFTRLKLFKKDYLHLPQHIRKKVDRQLLTLASNPQHPGIKARKMAGNRDLWEGRINGHYRMTFQIRSKQILLRRVGTHEIYKKP